MRHTPCVAALLVAALFALPAPAFAQLDNPSWGISVGFAPLWKVPDQLRTVLGADTLDIRGREFRVGLIRGTTLGGEWGVSLVHKRLAKDSKVAVRQSNDIISVVTNDAEMLGFEVHRFFSFVRIGHAQIGVNVGGGLAEMRGFVTGSVQSAGGTAISAPIGFSELFTLAGTNLSVLPLARVEIAGAGLIGDRVKVRVGGGFNMPGIQVASVSVSWLMGRD